MGIYIREIAGRSREIAIYSQEMSADIAEMTENSGEMGIYRLGIARRSPETGENRGFARVSAGFAGFHGFWPAKSRMLAKQEINAVAASVASRK